MIRRQIVAAVTLMSLRLVAAGAFAQPALAYRVDDLGASGGRSVVGLTINDQGDVAVVLWPPKARWCRSRSTRRISSKCAARTSRATAPTATRWSSRPPTVKQVRKISNRSPRD
jgi:hypothetical protein